MREFIQGQQGQNGDTVVDFAQSLDTCGCFHPRKVHRMCSCVVSDRMRLTEEQQQQLLHMTPNYQETQTIPSDGCTRLWKCLSTICCGCCGCWYNCWGACATAQEHRELRRRLPKERYQIDYITMQPYSDYVPALQDIIERGDLSFTSHFKALSKLAKTIVRLFCGLFAVIAAIILLAGKRFPIARLIVVGATLGQALLVLYVVHWRKHRLDLSLDAVIKLFGSGFCFATGIAMIVEMISTGLGNLVFFIAIVFEIVEDDDPQELPSADDNNPNDSLHFMQTFAERHLLTFVLYVAFQAFVVAGLTEELSKYFCFWMVEHPDYPDERDDDGDALQEKGVHSTASAITCGMVATAAGFACAENFLYVFGEGLSISGGTCMCEFVSDRGIVTIGY